MRVVVLSCHARKTFEPLSRSFLLAWWCSIRYLFCIFCQAASGWSGWIICATSLIFSLSVCNQQVYAARDYRRQEVSNSKGTHWPRPQVSNLLSCVLTFWIVSLWCRFILWPLGHLNSQVRNLKKALCSVKVWFVHSGLLYKCEGEWVKRTPSFCISSKHLLFLASHM